MLPRRLLVLLAALAAVVGLSTGTVAAVGGATAQDDDDRLTILLTNDDGWIGAGGSETPLIVALRDALVADGHEVTVVAPATDQSGTGTRISSTPLTLANPEPGVWTVTGSPSDSVFLGVEAVFGGEAPDLVVSGMNPGGNYSALLNHSGTVGATVAALELGIPAVAMSIDSLERDAYPLAAAPAARYTADLVMALAEGADEGVDGAAGGGGLLPDDVALNVNYPAPLGPADASGTRSVAAPVGARLTTADPNSYIEFRYAPDGGQPFGEPGVYRLAFTPSTTTPDPGSDREALAAGFISINPISADRTAPDVFDVDGSLAAALKPLLDLPVAP